MVLPGLFRLQPSIFFFIFLVANVQRCLAEPADAIIARVNGEAILLSQLKQAALDQDVPTRALLGDPLHNEAYRRSITQLIDETLLVQKATAEEIKIDETEVAREVDGMLKELQNQFGSHAELEKYLAAHKLSLGTLRQILTERERRRALAARVVLKRVQVETGSLADFIKQRQAKGEATEELNLSQIIIHNKSEDNKSGERAKEDPQRRALKIMREAGADPSKFAALAREQSDDPTVRETGGYMGWVNPQTLLPSLRGQLSGMKPGDVSPPIDTPQGYHILLLHARHDARDLLFARRFAEERSRLAAELRAQANIKLYDLQGNALQLKTADLPTSFPEKSRPSPSTAQ